VQLVQHVVVGAVLCGSDGLVADVGDDHLESLRVAPVLLQLDELVRLEHDQRHALVGKALDELVGELTFEPVHEHPEDVHTVDVLEIHDCSFLSWVQKAADATQEAYDSIMIRKNQVNTIVYTR